MTAYILGCFATGYYLVRMRTGQDIRELAEDLNDLLLGLVVVHPLSPPPVCL